MSQVGLEFRPYVLLTNTSGNLKIARAFEKNDLPELMFMGRSRRRPRRRSRPLGRGVGASAWAWEIGLLKSFVVFLVEGPSGWQAKRLEVFGPLLGDMFFVFPNFMGMKSACAFHAAAAQLQWRNSIKVT